MPQPEELLSTENPGATAAKLARPGSDEIGVL